MASLKGVVLQTSEQEECVPLQVGKVYSVNGENPIRIEAINMSPDESYSTICGFPVNSADIKDMIWYTFDVITSVEESNEWEVQESTG